MTFAIFYSVAGRAGMTSGGYPSVEPGHNVLTHIIWSVPEGTTSKMVSEMECSGRHDQQDGQ